MYFCPAVLRIEVRKIVDLTLKGEAGPADRPTYLTPTTNPPGPGRAAYPTYPTDTFGPGRIFELVHFPCQTTIIFS